MTDVVFDIRTNILEMGICVKVSCTLRTYNTGAGKDRQVIGRLTMSLSANVNEKAALIWAIADKLTGVYKPHEYGEVILPLTVIRRFEEI